MYCLRRFQPLVQRLSRSRWVDHIKGNRRNQSILGRADDLEEFLFETSRQSLLAFGAGLRKLDGSSCFYCGGPLASVDVDHFIPFSQYPRDLAHNFVLSHPNCNRSKSDMLAAKRHLERWLERLLRRGNELAEIGIDAGLVVDAETCRRVASWGYSRAHSSQGSAWVSPNLFEEVDESYVRIVEGR
jgi:5-methylcytosine-specific restriction endonuclease McrA